MAIDADGRVIFAGAIQRGKLLRFSKPRHRSRRKLRGAEIRRMHAATLMKELQNSTDEFLKASAPRAGRLSCRLNFSQSYPQIQGRLGFPSSEGRVTVSACLGFGVHSTLLSLAMP
jgi:hypothetical protein